jgi:hypothetical protein
VALKQGMFVKFNPTTGIPDGATLGTHLGLFSLREYATNSQLTVNAQPYVDTAVADAAPTGGIILFPPGSFVVTKLQLFDGIYYQGAGADATKLIQPDLVNKSLVVSGENKTPINFQICCGVSNMTLRKATNPTDTLGSAIEMNCRVGELCRFLSLKIVGFPQSGIRLNRGGQPIVIRDIHIFACGEYGVDLRRTSGDIWNMVTLETVSGDNHKKGLIHIGGGGAPCETIRLANIKAECAVDGAMPCVIDLEGLGGMTVQIENLSLTAIKPVPAIIQINSSKATIAGGIVRAGGPSNANIEAITSLIDDVPASRKVMYVGKRFSFNYDSDVGLTASGVTVTVQGQVVVEVPEV